MINFTTTTYIAVFSIIYLLYYIIIRHAAEISLVLLTVVNNVHIISHKLNLPTKMSINPNFL